MVKWIKGIPPENTFNNQAWWVWDGETMFLACWINNTWKEAQSHFFRFEAKKITHYCSVIPPKISLSIIEKWCNCVRARPIQKHGYFVICANCHKCISCELCEDYNIATIIYSNYVVCKEHSY